MLTKKIKIFIKKIIEIIEIIKFNLNLKRKEWPRKRQMANGKGYELNE